jgi:hypothetical protein
MVMLSYLTPVNQGLPTATCFPGVPNHPGQLKHSFNPYVVTQQPLQQQQHRPFVNQRSNQPSDFDILLGKEKSIFNHDGNRRFRAIINGNLEKYVAAPTKSSKSKLIRQVHADMEKSGFRFLRKNEVTGVWFEIESHEAREKVSHALRDRVREQQKPTKRRRKDQQAAKEAAAAAVGNTSASQVSSPPPPSVVSLESDSSKGEKDNDDDDSAKSEQPKRMPLNLPTLCNDDLTLDGPFSKPYFEFEAPLKDHSNALRRKVQRRFSLLSFDDDLPPKAQRRYSILSIEDDLHVKPQRRFSLLSLENDVPSKPQRRFSIDSMENYEPVRYPRRMSLQSVDDFATTKALRRFSILSVEDEPEEHTKAPRRLSMLSMFDDLANSNHSIKSFDRELKAIENDLHHELVDDGDYDAYQPMPINGRIDESIAVHMIEIAVAL